MINFHNDICLSNIIDEIESELDKPRQERNEEEIIERLKRLIKLKDEKFTPDNVHALA